MIWSVHRWKFSLLISKLVAIGVALNIVAAMGDSIAQTPSKPLSGNDVSILFPSPKSPADMANLIALSDLAGPTGSPQRLWSEEAFSQFLANAESPERPGTPSSGVNRIGLPDGVKKIGAWFVSGIRIDPGAPGLSKDIITQFGRQPQIRLIVQPVTNGPEGFKVHDIAGHLIFSFTLSPPDSPLVDCAPFPRSKPDDETFKAVIRDIADLRDQLANGKFGGVKIATTGDLNVHPGLSGPSAKQFRDALKGLLQKNLSPDRLNTMAVIGIDAPEPWIFVSMLKIPRAGFIAVPGPTLDGLHVPQMFSIIGAKHVVPQPSTNNQNPITCRHAALQNPPLPKTDRKGVSTSAFIDGNVADSRVIEIVNIIADPKQSHFFNTDCVSCHTETAQPITKNVKNFSVPGVNPAVLPKENWNVRNFGWFPSFLQGAPAAPTITRRTAAETADVVSFINNEMLNK